MAKKRFNSDIMVSGFISKIGKGMSIFVDQNAKINAKIYQEILKKHLREIKKLSGKRQYTIQQDGARAHIASSTIVLLVIPVPQFIGEHDWPANSCDLNPLDYAIWGCWSNLFMEVTRDTIRLRNSKIP